jgi:pyruvate dehydrogenase E2 component (dihydrolipoamide acetyltransferase)
MSEIVMPRLSDSMTEGTVVRWLKQPGENVARGEPIVEIETDKATITYESDVDGVMAEILVGEGQTVPIGTQIARIEQAGAPGGQQAAAQQQAAPQQQQAYAQQQTGEQPAYQQPPQQPQTQAAPAAGGDEGRVKASPIARRLAKKLGVDLTTVAGTGPGGRIVKEDVEGAASAAAGGLAGGVPQQQAPDQGYQQFDAPPPQYEQTGEQPAVPHPEQPPAPMPTPEEPAFEPPAQPPAPEAPPAEPAPSAPGQPYGAPQTPTAPGGPGVQPIAPIPGAMPGGVPGAMPPGMPGQLAGPAPFVSGMTGGFPAVSPQGMPLPGAQIPGVPPQPGAAAAGSTATRGQSTTSDPTSFQQTVARRMAESKATAPDYWVEMEVDVTLLVAYREQLKMSIQPVPSFNDFVIKASAQALRQYPMINAAYKDGHYEQYGDVNIGFVVSAGDLLVVPTLFAADRKGLSQIARESQELANAVRSRTIQPAQLSGGTFSISNLGMYGVDRFTAIINPPQAAILAVGSIKRKPVIAEDGMTLTIRQLMSLTLTCDHRILYGAEAAEFLGAIKAWLESPQSLPV